MLHTSTHVILLDFFFFFQEKYEHDVTTKSEIFRSTQVNIFDNNYNFTIFNT